MAPKRSASAAGSPPPSTNPPKAKKPRAPRPKKPKKSAAAAAKEAKSPPASSPAAAAAGTTGGARSPALDAFGGQSPTPEGSPRSRRDGSLAPGQGADKDKGSKGSKGKGKERAETAQPPAEGQDGGPSLAAAEQEDQDAEDEVFEFSDDEFGDNQAEAARQKEDLRVLLEHFDENQMDRYEAYRRSGLTKSSVRKLVNAVLQQSVSPSILTVVRGFAKVFVGEIVEKARQMSDHPGSLTPQDLREAYRIYQQEHEGPGAGGSSHPKKLFVR
ncbi:hypothetical protein JCM8115_006214 [Rhodotorula mucilaginosa]